MSDEQQEVKRPSRIDLRTKSLTDEHVKELIAFYEGLQKSDKDLTVNVSQEVSEETRNYIQIEFYSKDGETLDGVMIPYKE